jgi:hypothetical protein
MQNTLGFTGIESYDSYNLLKKSNNYTVNPILGLATPLELFILNKYI